MNFVESMVMLSGDTLYVNMFTEYSGKISEDEALFVAEKVVQALMIVHSRDVFHRDISEDSIGKAVSVFVKALCFLGILYIFLLWSESKSISMGIFTETDLLFEVCSALGTVGLSRGLTPNLSTVGKILVIVLMFAGRTGITFIALNKVSRGPNINALTDYPKETVILG